MDEILTKQQEEELKRYLGEIAEAAGYYPECQEIKVEEWYGEIIKIISNAEITTN